MKQTILMADMQSFYASVEKASHPEWANKPVIVSGDPEKRSGIILAACPLAKKYGIETTEPLWQARRKCPEAVIVRPRMQLYIDVSCLITSILERYSDKVEVFSIDEQFIDVTGSTGLFGDPALIARQMQQEILEQTGIFARVGIAPNKVLAKMACDAFAKKNKSGIARLSDDNFREKMWPLPVSKLFGVGSRMKQHLNRIGIRTIGQLAEFPVDRLRKRWGINGEVLWRFANGIDLSPVSPDTHEQHQKAIGHRMTLPRDYETAEEIRVILLELSEEVARRARRQGYIGQTASLTIGGTEYHGRSGFHRQIRMLSATSSGLDLYRAILPLFEKHWDGLPIRSAGISLSQLSDAATIQLNLFEPTLQKERLNEAMDAVRDKYGPTAMFRASSLAAAGQVHERAAKIGGHYK
ncbi:DNA polymerase IV [Aciduricibacillus chroicocephali]|uniref:DNA polymerase IV n=1 Tax=Aciduricibacillus chroicocephali TaxID=3054939 RepID=A0ABY9KRQ4_9BACI|nr:DNA polymerase IV [Bacillaceae bacterium 44XB]